jgi:hypothetical protein
MSGDGMHMNRRTWFVYGTTVAIVLAGVAYIQVQSMRHSASVPSQAELSPQEELLKTVLNATEAFRVRHGRTPKNLSELRSSDARFAAELSKERLSVLRGGLMFTPMFLALKGTIPDAKILIAAESGESQGSAVYVILADGQTRAFPLPEVYRQVELLQHKLKEMKPATGPSEADKRDGSNHLIRSQSPFISQAKQIRGRTSIQCCYAPFDVRPPYLYPMLNNIKGPLSIPAAIWSIWEATLL